MSSLLTARSRLCDSMRADDASILLVDRLGNRLSNFALEITPPASPIWANDFLCIRVPCFQRWYLLLVGFGFFPDKLLKTSNMVDATTGFAKGAMWQ